MLRRPARAVKQEIGPWGGWRLTPAANGLVGREARAGRAHQRRRPPATDNRGPDAVRAGRDASEAGREGRRRPACRQTPKDQVRG